MIALADSDHLRMPESKFEFGAKLAAHEYKEQNFWNF